MPVCWCAPYPLASHNRDCRVFNHLGDAVPVATIGFHDGQLVADVAAYERWKHLGGEEVYKWRSGVKHDCSKVMELRKEGNRYRNGLDEVIELEDDYVYPMLKSSEITNGQSKEPSRWMLVTQKAVGDETSVIRRLSHPNTWEYLQKQGDLLDRRASSIYRNRPRFSVFGVGDYTFAPWKVAISGFYKKLQFATVGPYAGKPVVLDDTSYFVACQSEQEARFIAGLLNSQPAREFFSAFVFWDAKRPITIDMLRRLDLVALACELGSEETLASFQAKKRTEQPNRQADIVLSTMAASRRRLRFLPSPASAARAGCGGIASRHYVEVVLRISRFRHCVLSESQIDDECEVIADVSENVIRRWHTETPKHCTIMGRRPSSF